MAAYDFEDITWFAVDADFAARFDALDVWGTVAAPSPKLTGVVPVAAGFCRDLLGYVLLKGKVKGGTIGAAAFVLPVSYRPDEDKVFDAHTEDTSNSVLGTVVVKTTGEVVVATGGNALVSLDGIRFRAA